MGRMALRASLMFLVLALGLTTGWAQEQPAQQQQHPTTQKPNDSRVAPPATPIPPLSTQKTKGETSTTGGSQSTFAPEQGPKPLTGAETYTLETMGRGHSYIYPLFQTAQSVDTNSNNQIGSSKIESISTINGSFTVNHIWNRYSFTATYAGVGLIDNRDPSLNSSAHSFSISQMVRGLRSSFLLADSVSYLPESSFGYDRFGGFSGYSGSGGLSGVDTSGLNGMYIPNQSILTGNSSRISNAAVGQYGYNLSPLSSVTFMGGYTLLRFPSSGFINSSAGMFGFGYNHAIGRNSSVAINYTGSLYRYNNLPASNFTNHAVELMYGHLISRRFSLQLGAGPQINIFSNLSGGRTVVSWYATASLDYLLSRSQLSLRYWHYTSGGAGVYSGAQTDNLELDAGRKITRMWSGSVGLGYSYNKSLQGASTSPTFNTWYASANLQRTLGPYMSMFLSYNLQQQSSGGPFCIGGSCGSFYTRNYFSLGFSWHPRSVELGGVD